MKKRIEEMNTNLQEVDFQTQGTKRRKLLS